jgi:aspartyl-tRNA(Asn)/glutamyl-tRNA(Gln) amidotransferase subunit C
MNLSLKDVYRIAHLARVEIDAAHAEEVRAKLASIFGLIDELTAVDTTGVEPMAHAQDATLPLRADEVTEPDLSERYQALAPAADDGLYLVPKSSMMNNPHAHYVRCPPRDARCASVLCQRPCAR